MFLCVVSKMYPEEKEESVSQNHGLAYVNEKEI